MEFKQPLSKEIFERKYCLHGETSPEEVFMEIAKEIASVEKQPEQVNVWKNIFYDAMASGEFMPAGRVLANARLYSKLKNYNNCFTIDLLDSMVGIYEPVVEDAIIGQVGGGVGFNASKLRPKRAKISKGGESSGVMSFLEVFDTSAKAIHTGGGRRCLPKGTEVHTKKGPKNIENISVGDEVLTSDGYEKVSNFFIQGEQKTITIHTSNGDFECTPNHKMAVFDGCFSYTWKEAKDLKNGDKLVFVGKPIDGEKTVLPEFNYEKPEKSTTSIDIKIPELDEDIAWLFGVIFGDGYVWFNEKKSKGGVSIACSNNYPEIIQKAKSQLERFGVNVFLKNGDGDLTNVTAYSNQLGIYFGQFKEANKSLNVPEFIKNGTIGVRSGFLAGLFDADGSSKTRPVKVITTVYEDFAYQIKKVLNTLGIPSHISSIDRSNDGWQTIYNVALSNAVSVRSWDEMIGIYSKKYSSRRKTESFYQSGAYDFGWDRSFFLSEGIKNNWKIWNKKSKNIKLTTLERIIDKRISLYPVDFLETTECRTVETFDIEVENKHEFVAEGFLTHNSAHIAILNIWHPDIEEFIEYKRGKENNALTQFNISVGITDDFMNCVAEDKDWNLVFPLMKFEKAEENNVMWYPNPFDKDYCNEQGYILDENNNVLMKIYKTVKARDLYEKMTKQAWWYNEPGVLFLDTIEKENNAQHAFKVDRCNPCVAKGTLVNTPYGYRKVEEIKEGDLVCSLHKNGYEPVKTVEVHEDTFVNKTVFSDGTVQYITDAHIYHVKDRNSNRIKRVRFDSLKIGDKIQHQPTEILGGIHANSWEYKKALLAGILLGDGCYTEKTIEANNNIKISTSVDDVEYNSNLISLIKELGYKVGEVYCDGKSRSATVSIGNAEEVLRDLGLMKFKSFEKEIPDFYLNNKDKIAGVINGLLATDGNVLVRSGSMPLVRFKTSSEKLYTSYRRALLNLGVKCGMYYGDKDKQTSGIIDGRQIERKHSTYEAYTSGEFAKKLIKSLPNNINPKKQDKMNEILYNYITNGNNHFLEIVEIDWHVRKDTVYDLFCEESDTWITEGLVQQGCGEIVMPAYSLCCLSAINLSKLVNNSFTDKAEFDYYRFKELVRIGVRFLDNVLDATDYPLEKIKKISKDWRRIGLGITGVGDALMKMKIRYGSEESVKFINFLGYEMANEAYLYSTQLAEEKGSFPAYDSNIGNYGFIRKLNEDVQKRIKEVGLRNIGLLTIAPCGTTSLTIGNNCSSGIEPIFSLQYDRTVRQEDNSLKTETVYDDGWLEFVEMFPEYANMENLPDYVVVSHDISIKEGIDVQSAFQYWIDHSISRTINMPFETTLDEYKDIFMYSWKKGLKGTTSFHEGASMDGILSTKPKKDDKETWKTIEILKNATKRPEELPCDIFEIQVNKEPVIVLVGKNPDAPYNGAPYEIFYTDNADGIIDLNKAKEGKIIKITDGNEKPSRYDLVIEGKRSEFVLKDLAETFNDDYATMCRLLSLSMRHQIPLEFIVAQMNKVKKFGTFQKAVARVLKKYIPDGEMISSNKAKCPECGGVMIFESGCTVCSSCGYSTCG